MQNKLATVVVLGTGGTIAGTIPGTASAGDVLGYTAAQLGVDALVSAVSALAASPVETEQIAQLDSKDMDAVTWLRLARRAEHHLARDDVAGIVVTHGTDTLEETAYFLHRVLAPQKPVVFTGAMRPANALSADGPQNLADALALACWPGACGVFALLGGALHAAVDVRKAHPWRIDAFDSGDAGALAQFEAGQLRQHRPWPVGVAFGASRLPDDVSRWPQVEVVTSHAGATGASVEALVAGGIDGIVAAGSGNGSLHVALEAALRRAHAGGVAVLLSSRCGDGAVLASSGADLPTAGALSPVKARIELMLQLMPAG